MKLTFWKGELCKKSLTKLSKMSNDMRYKKYTAGKRDRDWDGWYDFIYSDQSRLI